MSLEKKVTCPGCGGEAIYSAENPHRPFCSEACRQHDWGSWLCEEYRIEERSTEAELDQEPNADVLM